MAYEDAILKCKKGHKTYTTVGKTADGKYEIDEELENCSECDGPMSIVPLSKSKDPEDFIILADMELENANHHDLSADRSYEAATSNLRIKDPKIKKHVLLAIAKGLHSYFTSI